MRSFKKFSVKFVFLGYCASSLGIFRALKLKSEYFLEFSKKKFPTSIPITTKLRVPR